MKRKIYTELINWKNSKDFKPLVILGVRQCGKTYIIDEFCKNEYKNYKKINLFENTEVIDLYKSNKNSDRSGIRNTIWRYGAGGRSYCFPYTYAARRTADLCTGHPHISGVCRTQRWTAPPGRYALPPLPLWRHCGELQGAGRIP